MSEREDRIAALDLAAMRREAQLFADHLAPAMEDDNNYYRGLCPLDGKDAADIGELCVQVVQLIDSLDQSPQEGREG